LRRELLFQSVFKTSEKVREREGRTREKGKREEWKKKQ
jgi:hypothetical protein